MKYFDAHCHVQFDGYDADREELIARMKEEEVGGLVVGVDAKSSKQAIALAQAHEHLYASIGLHPNYVSEEKFDFVEYEKLAQDGKVVAIGECGLDYFRPAEPDAAKQKQREVFNAHIELAVKLEKPLMIHARPSKDSMDAYEDALTMLESAKREHGEKLSGDFHFFVGNVDIARRVYALDFTTSYTAVITFARDYDEVIKFAPLSQLLSETDSPYVAPASRRGERNDPLTVKEVVRTIAEIRGEDEETVREAILQNVVRVFKLGKVA